ncbi:MGT family glycosyltransferase [Streptomyces sp. DG2A-72]|uniref:macrolide family glycosyltransferase n=1 Tax=Streptomyces sp. DG2A-72 TaxID=3051386 RepID=UPI00265C0832|nr:macrolide family glycosyltransferase [Streptomyces sp. DG2A-72]MDO0938354.1 MGT family glycosyltransferase [Streptomyces sp. DG2A-72]
MTEQRPARHYLFFAAPAHGHVRPTLPVAAELVRRGHRVSYATTEPFAAEVGATGAGTVLYDPAVPDFAGAVPGDSPDWLPLALTAAIAESSALLATLVDRFGDAGPDVVAYDTTMNPAGRLLTRLWQLPAVEFSPVFLPQRTSNPGFSLAAMLQGSPQDGSAERPAVRRFREDLTALLAGYGAADVSPLDFVTGFRGLRMAFFPRDFQPGGDLFDDRHVFVGPCLDPSPPSAAWQPPADGRPVVLVSLGTSYSDRPEFFRTCVKAFADSPWHAVLTVGRTGVDPAELGPLPAQVEVHRWLPHLAVLPHARAFVCQAGMGSVMEALACGTPLVLAAQAQEQRMVARRAVALGLGTEVPGGEDLTAAALLDAVGSVADDPQVHASVAGLRERIREAGGTARAADVLERLGTS